MNFDRKRAWFATQNMLVSVGGAALVGAMLTMHWIMLAGASGAVAAVWGTLYKIAGAFQKS